MVFSPFSRLTSFNRLASNVPLRTFSHHVHKLRVFAFLWANTLALGSCLCDNRSKTRQRQAVVLSSIPPYKPSRKPLRPLRPLRLCVPFSHLLLTLNTDTRSVIFTEDKGEFTSNYYNNPRILSVSPFSFFSVFRRRPQRQRPLLTDVVVLDFISRRDAETQRLKHKNFFVYFRIISWFQIPPKNLRASFSPFSPCFAEGHSVSDKSLHPCTRQA